MGREPGAMCHFGPQNHTKKNGTAHDAQRVRVVEPCNVTPMGANSISPAHLHVRTMGRTCKWANEIQKTTHAAFCNRCVALTR